MLPRRCVFYGVFLEDCGAVLNLWFKSLIQIYQQLLWKDYLKQINLKSKRFDLFIFMENKSFKSNLVKDLILIYRIDIST